MKKRVPFAAVLMLATAVFVQAADNMKVFPPAEKGMVRDESLLKVELIVGKTVPVDQKNRYFFGGRVHAQTIVGWGFTRYIVSELGPMAGTRMAVDPNAPQVDRFVALVGEPYLIRYNSRLPVIAYVPEGAEVRYRIWRAGSETKTMEKG